MLNRHTRRHTPTHTHTFVYGALDTISNEDTCLQHFPLILKASELLENLEEVSQHV